MLCVAQLKRISPLVALSLFSVIFLCLAESCCIHAQATNNGGQSTTPNNPDNPIDTAAAANQVPGTKTAKKIKKHFLPESIVIAPLPMVSPAIGSGIIPVVGYIFPFDKKDKISPPSTIGAAGLITNNGTRAWALGGQLFLDKNTYEITAGYAHGNINYNIYGTGFDAGQAGEKLPLVQTGQVFFAEALRRTVWQFFVGPRFTTGTSFITLGHISDPNIPPIPPDVGLESTLRALGVRTVRDTRPNHFYPAAGSKTEFTADFFAQALGSKSTFQSYKLDFNKYWTVHKNQVLAYEFTLCDTGGDAPFYKECLYGTSNELRGYVAGQYIDRHMFATQAEYRVSFPHNFGLAGFTGIGEVVPGFQNLFTSSHFLPDIGGGPRYSLSSKYHVNLRADFARGRGSWTWSMGIGEAF